MSHTGSEWQDWDLNHHLRDPSTDLFLGHTVCLSEDGPFLLPPQAAQALGARLHTPKWRLGC